MFARNAECYFALLSSTCELIADRITKKLNLFYPKKKIIDIHTLGSYIYCEFLIYIS